MKTAKGQLIFEKEIQNRYAKQGFLMSIRTELKQFLDLVPTATISNFVVIK